MSYTVEIKRSAFQGNTAVFSEFNDSGLQHDFPNKQEAKEWAERLSLRGERDVYIRNASELDNDKTIDGYLVGR